MMTFEEIKKFNPYHDRKGRFTTSGGAASFTIRTKDPAKQSLADRGIAREKERTKDWKAPAPKKVSNVKLSSDNMPKFLTKTKANTKCMTNFCNAINANKDADPDCVKVLSKLSEDEFNNNGVGLKLSNASTHSVSMTHSVLSRDLSEVKVTIPKVQSENDVASIVTTAHELTHFVDLTQGGNGQTINHSSSDNRDLMDAIRNGRGANQNVSDETASFFKDMNDYFKSSSDKRGQELNDRYKEINKKYGLDNGGNLWNLSIGEITAYQKERKAARKEYYDNVDNDLRTYNGGAATALSDMYDAMCAGAKMMKGTRLLAGHDPSYYASVGNRSEELLANFVAIGVTNPKLLKYFANDYPDVYNQLQTHVRKMAEA